MPFIFNHAFVFVCFGILDFALELIERVLSHVCTILRSYEDLHYKIWMDKNLLAKAKLLHTFEELELKECGAFSAFEIL